MRIKLTLVLVIAGLVVGCTTDEDPADAVLDATAETETVSTPDTTETTDSTDDALERSGPSVDIVGIELDLEDRCVSPDLTTLGRGQVEPPIFIPRCLEAMDTGVQYLVRPGSRAVPTGYRACDLGDALGWRTCGTVECDESVMPTDDDFAVLEYARCDDYRFRIQCAGPTAFELSEHYWNSHTWALVIARNPVDLGEPWEAGFPAEFPPPLTDYAPTDEACP